MRILLITPLFSPLNDPRSHRWSSIAEHWGKEGHEVICLTEKVKGEPNFSQKNGIEIHRVGIGLPGLIESFSKKKKQQNIGPSGGGFGIKYYLQKFFFYFVFPDFSFMWYPFAIRKVKRILAGQQFDLMITSALPFTSHLVGLYAKKRNPDLKWIGDWGDPFTFQEIYPVNNRFLYGKLNKKLEYRVFECLHAAVMTNEGAGRLYAGNFPDQADKIHVIPPLFDVKIMEDNTSQSKEISEIINCGYFGIFYKKNREPKLMLEVFSKLITQNPSLKNRIRINIFGKNFDRFKNDFDRFPNLKQVVTFKGLIPKSEVSKEMSRQQILINIGNFSGFQLPSKAPEYMASGKPIINFTSITNDTFAEFCKPYPLLINLQEGEESAAKKLGEFILKNSGKQLAAEERKKYIRENRVEVVAKGYLLL